MTTNTAVDTRVACAICGYRSHSLLDHVREAHGMTPEEYVNENAGHGLVSQELLNKMKAAEKGVRRGAAANPEDLTVKFGGFEFNVDVGVEAENCLPDVEGYLFPTRGKAKKAFKRALMALARGRNCYIHGMPGTGKDALVHAFSAMTRRPVLMVTFRPGTDLAPWFYVRAIGAEGTGWDYGHLWNGMVHGVACRDGVRRAPMILLSDVDRADSAQAEWFRILTDSISGRILDPHGKMVPLFKDADGRKPQFVCTANSVGSGDDRGRMASANPIDASILDRLGQKIKAEYMNWTDEGKVLRSMYPNLAAVCGEEFFEGLGNITKSIRKAIENGELYAELTMRGLCDICNAAEDILFFRKNTPPANILSLAMNSWVDGLDEDSKFEAKRFADPNANTLDEDVEDEDDDYDY